MAGLPTRKGTARSPRPKLSRALRQAVRMPSTTKLGPSSEETKEEVR